MFFRHVLRRKAQELPLEAVFIIVLSKFPHYWVFHKMIYIYVEILSQEQVDREVCFLIQTCSNNDGIVGCLTRMWVTEYPSWSTVLSTVIIRMYVALFLVCGSLLIWTHGKNLVLSGTRQLMWVVTWAFYRLAWSHKQQWASEICNYRLWWGLIHDK